MTRRIDDANIPVVLIEHEPDGECQMCHEKHELRPYGPGGSRVCFECAMKDPEETERQVRKAWGVDPR